MTNAEQKYFEDVRAQFSLNLLSFPDGIKYVENRGLTMEAISNGDVGFCPPYFDYKFPLLRGRIIVPIKDTYGRTIAFAGRKYEPMQIITENAIRELFSYKPSLALSTVQKWNAGKWINESFPKSKFLFNLDSAKYEIRRKNYAIIVEGYFDALVLKCHGILNVVALCGASLSEYHAALLARYCDHVLLLLDGDEAGKKGAEKSLPLIQSAKLTSHIITLPPKMDPDELILKYKSSVMISVFDKMIAENNPQLTLRAKL